MSTSIPAGVLAAVGPALARTRYCCSCQPESRAGPKGGERTDALSRPSPRPGYVCSFQHNRTEDPISPAPVTTRGQRTRAALIDAGRRVFERDGFLGARITDIAEEAGVAHGTFYTYFDSKEDLVREVASAVLSRTTPTVREIKYSSSEEAVSGIVAATRRYLEVYRENADLMAVIDQVATFDDDMQEMLTNRSRAFAERTEHHIIALSELTPLPGGLDPYSAAIALTGMVSQYARSVFRNSPNVTKRIDFDQSVRTLSVLWATSLGLVVPVELLET
jgi:AcrR family transcriptional regulator